MFDYLRNMQLAARDLVHRSAVKAVAGVVILIGLGFLLAALWSFLAHDLGWGSAHASLAIGGAFLLIGLLIIAFAGHARHQPPSVDELKREVEARLSLAADTASARARAEAMRIVEGATDRVTDAVDRATGGASRIFSGTGNRIRDTVDKVDTGRTRAQDCARKVQRAASSNPGSMARLIGAFAIGAALAAHLGGGGQQRGKDTEEEDGDDGKDDLA